MELKQYHLNDLEFVALPATAVCFSICDEDEGPTILVFIEEVEPVRKAA